MSTLSLQQVCKTYPNGTKAIKNANLEIESGEFVVFVGPSGCGKSTLLRMIAGLETISEGEIVLADTTINNLEPAKRDIAMVFQNYALYPHMSVYKNLAYGLVNRKFPKAEIDKRVRETAEMLQLAEYLESKPRELSGGQRQRVAMGRAIVREPKLFLFDEPLSNLDAKLRNTMRLEIKALQRRLNTTAIYVTHDQVEAMTMADKIVILNAGKVEQVGSPQAIYHQPANLFVATFIGSPAMNILDATLDQGRLNFTSGQSIDTDFDLPDSQQRKLLKVGIRPECIQLSPSARNDAPSLPISIDIVEDLGAQRVIHARLGKQPLLIVSEQENIREGDTRYAVMPLAHLYLFDPKTEANITQHRQ
ncbi:sn-glycerol-3-phosphate ABC transporter ATP-binding protein UgpC [Suttonella sp. R2A3]|uniref:ABC transporter ATP-binding protein n=1 Tax=Suttonella sp. R2A3 TaxID=2908648 RepID=UPI001F1F9069|nr:sn-glycerol-3-phosphate ABC transporter ATP-binding protein UgpC [Suttonella sp. R2A3]UJF23860.1 sn-glycerol-3-phosphate ABC transporter ATP-binding protein UgpC [Suttonella sp. R2A3]